MSLPLYLADKSALEQRHRNQQVESFLTALVVDGAVATCEMVALEVLFSARNRRDYERLWDELHGFPWVHVSTEAMRRAMDVQRLLASRGQHRLPLPDLVIAATAELGGATVLHFDRDFDTIARMTGQPTRWIARPGR